MTSKHSKKTLALLAQYPNFDDWIINNLSAEQLQAVMEAPFGTASFGDGHPLNSRKLGVQLWRAYWDQVVFELECVWGEDENHAIPPSGCDRHAYFHESVCMAVGNYANEQSELMEGVVARQRREIEVAASPAQSSVSAPGNFDRGKRL